MAAANVTRAIREAAVTWSVQNMGNVKEINVSAIHSKVGGDLFVKCLVALVLEKIVLVMGPVTA